MKRKAQAEVAVQMMNAVAKIELTELERRSIDRLVHQESRKQINIEKITDQAVASLWHDAKVETLDEDWVGFRDWTLNRWISKGLIVSSILAG